MRHGSKIRISLTDGSTLEGTLRFSWGWWSYKITAVTVHVPQGSIGAEGAFFVPRRSVLHVQVVAE